MSLTGSIAFNRSVKVTDRADLHAVTHFGKMCLKSLRNYLLSYKIWSKDIGADSKMYQDANTLLCGYTNILVLSKTDLRTAHSHGLINEDIS